MRHLTQTHMLVLSLTDVLWVHMRVFTTMTAIFQYHKEDREGF